MKILLVLALLAVAASAQLDPPCGEGGDAQEQWQWQMKPCREFLRQRCSPVAMPQLILSSCQVMRQQCCQQLRQIPPQSRCRAICSTVQSIIIQQQQQQQQQKRAQIGLYSCEPLMEAQAQAQLEMMQMAQSLPSMCSVYPTYCPPCATIATSTAGCY